MGRWLATPAVLALAIACARPGAFVCEDASDCNDGSFTGMCQPNGYCSFGDASCDSGQRYGDHAPDDLAGTCVLPGDVTTGDATTTGIGTTVSTLDGATLEEESTSTSTTGALDGPLDDEGTTTSTDPTSVTDTSPDTLEGGSTSTTGPDTTCGLPLAGDACSECLGKFCCDEALACVMDEACSCLVNCGNPMAEPNCADQCGMSEQYIEFSACISVACDEACGLQ